jgi:hypothetical protein
MGRHDEVLIRHGNHRMQFPKGLWDLVLRQERNDQTSALDGRRLVWTSRQ